MAGSEVQVGGGRLTANLPPRQTPVPGQQEDKAGGGEADSTEELHKDTKQGGGMSHCSSGCEEVSQMEARPSSIQLQLLFLISKADDIHNHLVNWQGCPEEEDFAALVSTFLNTCQPYFNYLESTARSAVHQNVALSSNIGSKLLSFSQQLCDRLEQLVLTFANYNVLCLEESEPHSVSHFCIGQCRLGRARLTAFLYPRPMPYLARVNTGWYKRMRWNVERLRNHGGDGKTSEREEVTNTEYYFLCYEDVWEAKITSDGGCENKVERMWTIGQWIQVNPDPNTEDIYDWILCEVPQAKYRRLLYLGNVEPSACSATNHLMELLTRDAPLLGRVTSCLPFGRRESRTASGSI